MARSKQTPRLSVAGSPPANFILKRGGRTLMERADEVPAARRSPYFKEKRKRGNDIKLKSNSIKREKKEVDVKLEDPLIKHEVEEKDFLLEKGPTLGDQKSNETTSDKGVPDFLDEDLKVLFVGINPGLMSAAKSHHYAGPTNHFWPCLSASGLVDRKVTYKDDQDLPSLYRLGFTNLTARATRKASELTLAEQRQGIPILNSKFETLRPKIACFIGKGIYEIYSKQKCLKMGLQDESHAIPWSNGEGKTLLFVMPSTSGIVTAYTKADKMKFFQNLNTAVNNLDIN